MVAGMAGSGCSSGSGHIGTLRGTLEAIGGPVPGTPRPIPGTIYIVGGGKTVKATVGSDGRFSAHVAAGTYTVTGRSPEFNVNGQEGLCLNVALGPVGVTAGGATTVTVVCSEK